MRTVLERFISKYIPVTESGCWLWIGSTNWRGYGEFSIAGRLVGAHRAAHELLKGPIPEGLTIDHLCRVRCCVNPDHLEAVPHRINLLRASTFNARNAAITHCPQGHPYAGSNLILRKQRAGRACRECKNANQRQRRSKASVILTDKESPCMSQ